MFIFYCNYIYLRLIVIHHLKEAFWIKMQMSETSTLNTSKCILREHISFLKYHIALHIIKFRKFNINKIQLLNTVLLKM